MPFKNSSVKLAEAHQLADERPYGMELALQVTKFLEQGGCLSVKYMNKPVAVISQANLPEYADRFKIIMVHGSMKGLFATTHSFAQWFASQSDNVFALTKTNKSALTRADIVEAINSPVIPVGPADFVENNFPSGKLTKGDLFLYYLPKYDDYSWITVSPDFVTIVTYVPPTYSYEEMSTETHDRHTHSEFSDLFKSNQYVTPVVEFLKAIG